MVVVADGDYAFGSWKEDIELSLDEVLVLTGLDGPPMLQFAQYLN